MSTMSSHATQPMTDGDTVVTSRPTPPSNTKAARRERIDVPNEDHTGPQRHDPATTSLREVCADIHGRVTRFLSAPAPDSLTRSTQEQTRIAAKVIEQALQDYDFNALSLSYNGGKDCLVLLIIYLSVLHTHFTQPSGRRKDDTTTTTATTTDFPTSIPSIYAKPPDPFDSVTNFVESSTADYHLDLTHISTNPGMSTKSQYNPNSSLPVILPTQLAKAASAVLGAAKESITNMTNGTSTGNTKSQEAEGEESLNKPKVTFRDAFALYLQAHPNVQAIFVGTRRTDPHGATLKHFQMTDGNWPRFMRIHPVIDWKLGEIWCFLRSEHMADPRTGQNLEYCEIYDMGYTSLGGVSDTLRNPRLSYLDDSGQEKYRPAYELTKDEEERAGREK